MLLKTNSCACIFPQCHLSVLMSHIKSRQQFPEYSLDKTNTLKNRRMNGQRTKQKLHARTLKNLIPAPVIIIVYIPRLTEFKMSVATVHPLFYSQF